MGIYWRARLETFSSPTLVEVRSNWKRILPLPNSFQVLLILHPITKFVFMNDRHATELISKSLDGESTEEEQIAVAEYLSNSAELQQLHTLLSTIESAATSPDWNESSSTENAEHLSQIAKERIRRTLQEAITTPTQPNVRKSDSGTSEYLKVAEAETIYYSRTTKPAQNPTPANNADATIPDESIRSASIIPNTTNEPESEPSRSERFTQSRFRLLRQIGEGGLGSVWLARDEYLKRNVAIKELKTTAAESPKLWRRFQREAEITAHLEHPNVVPLYLSGINPSTRMPFYAMRFLGKQTLSEAIHEYHAQRHLKNSHLRLHRLLNVFLDVCQAIAYAHSRGVIHRDLKPENVALDNFGQVLVLDWGLAKLDSDGELASKLSLQGVDLQNLVDQTLDGDVVGTPLYMSPEQAAGKLEQLDERTDIYGLGAILFAILTGHAPHHSSYEEHRNSSPSMKSFLDEISIGKTPSAKRLVQETPRELDRICRRAMAEDRFARFASATELADEVESWIAGRHEHRSRYDAMKMNGRDLKSRLCVQLRQLAMTAQFMVELPPVSGLAAECNSDEKDMWRERLSSILMALARTRPNISALSLASLHDNKIDEVVRVERSLQDSGNVRPVPRSRLRQGVANVFHKTVVELFPGEAMFDMDSLTVGQTRLLCGVPVFSDRSETAFGIVVAESEIASLVRSEWDLIQTTDEVLIINDRNRVIFSTKQNRTASFGERQASDLISNWDEVVRGLAIHDDSASPEYSDPDGEIYAILLDFPHGMSQLTIVIRMTTNSSDRQS